MALKIRRGLESARTGITPEAGEIIYTTDENKIYIGDGTTAGGDLVAGQKGEAGAAGSDGSAGAKGQKGEIGVTGADGADGSIGVDGAKGQKGETGLGFNIAKTYVSVAALTADTSPTGIVSGEFAIIETGDNEDADNSKIYLWNGSVYSYVSDLSGAAGITGPAGSEGSAGAAGDKGQKGEVGVTGADASLVISETAPSSPIEGDMWFDSTTLKTFTYYTDEDSSQWVVISPEGPQGAKGQKGEVGVTGAAGSAGAAGADGAKGQKGEVGVTGAAGSAGSAGADGAKGQKGEVGVTGAAGSAGSAGADGAKGQKGEVGASGVNVSSIDELTDVDISTAAPTDGQSLVWDNANSKFIPGAASGGGGASVVISDTAPSSPSEGDLWLDSSTLNVYIYYNDGSSSQWVNISASSGGADTKTYSYSGELEVNNGTKRLYVKGNATLSSADIHLETAAAGASVNLTINKNGSSAGTLTIADGATASLSNALSVSLAQGDYLTVDITQVGSSTAGSDLYLLLTLT